MNTLDKERREGAKCKTGRRDIGGRERMGINGETRR